MKKLANELDWNFQCWWKYRKPKYLIKMLVTIFKLLIKK